jgi:hypothetical protein
MRVIYIAGASHSGSTLLDVMLNAHPAIVSVGELMNLNRLPPTRKIEPFWSRVDQQIQQVTGRSMAELDIENYTDANATSDPNTILFKAISDVSGKGVVVDSSKSYERMAYLMQLKELDVYPVHLIRDAKGQIASVIRKHGGFLKHIYHYEVVHRRIRRLLRGVPHSVVRYEDLVLSPDRTLGIALEPLGLEFHPQQLSWAEHAKHLIAGNRMRRRKASELVLDEKWRDSLSLAQRLTIDIGTLGSRLASRRTGYVSGPG